MTGSGSITSYRDTRQLLKLRDLIFKDLDDHVSLRSALVNILCWQSRGKLPHAVDVTACILSAIINDTKDSHEISSRDKKGLNSTNNQLMLRNAYSMSLVRFVNGILDPYQQGTFAMALSTLAKSIKLPHSFVELRHCATHEALPSLELLRTTSREALRWLYDNFWTTLNTRVKSSSSVDSKFDFESVKVEIELNLKTLFTLSSAKNKDKNETVICESSQAAKYLKAIAENNQSSFELIQILIQKNYLSSIACDSSMLDEDVSFIKNPGFLLQTIFALLMGSQTGRHAKRTETQSNERPNSTLNCASSLISMVKQGPFPFKLHNKIYACEDDVSRSIAIYSKVLQKLDNGIPVVIDDKVDISLKRKPAKAPSLDEILNSSTTFTMSDGTFMDSHDSDRQFKRRKTSHFISEATNWDTMPFAFRRGTPRNDA